MSVAYWQGDVCLLQVLVQPRASRDEVVGLHADHLKVRITAAPVDGDANHRLLHYLGKQFNLPASRLRLVRGESARRKLIAIDCQGKLPARLEAFLPELGRP